jgi:threonyl-tRNA synthetase
LDFVLPERLDAEYVADSNEKTRPVMLHRAILGSLERFIGILIENHAGAFPTWLAPVQVVVANITESQSAYVHDVVAQLKALGIRAEADTRNEKINYKIREHSLQKIPYQLVVGDKEKDSAAVAVRLRGEDLGAMPVVDLIARIQADILAK